MIRVVILTFCSFMILITTGCNKGRYTDDRHYVGNPERPQATSESTTGNMRTGQEQRAADDGR
jgi:hypothetical protein